MKLNLTCPRGHRWEAPIIGPQDTQHSCPTCGAAPLAQLAPAVSAPGGTLGRTLPQAVPAAVATVSGPRIAAYEILGELGRGGMGVVYQARHRTLKRVVALKMVLSGAHAGTNELARFRIEAEAVARLLHPNIVQIYEVGEHDGQPFCTLEYVPGGSLAQHLNGKPLPPDTAAKLLTALAEGIQHAHEHGIVHRDLKPANVLIPNAEPGARNAEPSSLSTPRSAFLAAKITDFGLAKHLDDPSGQTKSGTILGTPSYMAPEQALGKNREIGPATDIYSLGAILYECLTGRPPFKAETSLDTMLQVASQEPVPPRRINNQVPPDLETICLKCMRKEPGKRYPTARELADDLGRFLRNEPIRARPVGVGERAVKWVKRRPIWTAALALFILFPLLTGVIVGKWRHRDPVEVTVVNLEELTRYANLIGQAERECREGNFNQAEQILKDCPEQLRGWEWDYLHRLCNWGLVRTHTGFGGVVRQVAFGTENRLAVAFEQLPGAHLREALDGKELSRVGEKFGSVNALAFSPDGKQLATVAKDGFLRVYDVPSGKELAGRNHGGPLACLAFSPDGKWLAAGGGAGQKGILSLWAFEAGLPSNQPKYQLPGTAGPVTSAAFSFDNLWLSALSPDVPLSWQVAGGQKPFSFNGKGRRLIFTPLGPHVAVLADTIQASRLNVYEYGANPKILPGFDDPPNRVQMAMKLMGNTLFTPLAAFDDQPDPRMGSRLMDAAFHADGKFLALAGGWPNQGKVRVYRNRKNTNFNASIVLIGHASGINSVAFSPDRNPPLLATGGHDGVRVWDPTIRRFDAPIPAPAPPTLTAEWVDRASPGMVFSPDGQRLAFLERNAVGVASLWDMHTGQKITCSNPTKAWLMSLCFTKNGRLAALDQEGTVCVWDAATGKTLDSLPAFPNKAKGNGFLIAHGDGFRLVSWTTDRPGIQLLDLSQNGKQSRLLGEQAHWGPSPPILSSDGERLAALDLQGTLTLWNAATGQVLLSAPGPKVSPCFSNDGRYLFRLTSAPQKPLEIWDAQTGKPTNLRLPTEPVGPAVQFAPDGKLLAWPDNRGQIFLWNAAAGRRVATLDNRGSSLSGLVFSADSRRLFSANVDNPAVRIWDTATGLEICTLLHARGNGGRLLLSPDGRRLALRNTSGAFIWDATPLAFDRPTGNANGRKDH